MSARSRAHSDMRRALLAAKSAAGKARAATSNQHTAAFKRSQQMVEILIAICDAHNANDHDRIDQLHRSMIAK